MDENFGEKTWKQNLATAGKIIFGCVIMFLASFLLAFNMIGRPSAKENAAEPGDVETLKSENEKLRSQIANLQGEVAVSTDSDKRVSDEDIAEVHKTTVPDSVRNASNKHDSESNGSERVKTVSREPQQEVRPVPVPEPQPEPVYEAPSEPEGDVVAQPSVEPEVVEAAGAQETNEAEG